MLGVQRTLGRNAIMVGSIMVKAMTVLDDKLTKSVSHFEENKFCVGGHQFLLDCCPKLIKNYNFIQNGIDKRQLKIKMNNIVQLGCLFSKLPRLFVNFLP
jgi:hypothetical protein